MHLRRRSEGHEGQAERSPDPWRNRTGSPAQVRAISNETAQDQGGHVEKANDPRPERLLAKPRCGSGCSGEDAKDPEDPANSREVAEAFEPELTGT
jgi:hypothetical protein